MIVSPLMKRPAIVAVSSASSNHRTQQVTYRARKVRRDATVRIFILPSFFFSMSIPVLAEDNEIWFAAGADQTAPRSFSLLRVLNTGGNICMP